MPDAPNIIILHGDDELSIEQKLAACQADLGEASMAEMNTTRLDGWTMSPNDLWDTAGAMPFLASRRLVIVTNPLPRPAKSEADPARERLLRDLERIPPSTTLVLVIADRPDRRRGWESFPQGHWLRTWVAGSGGRASIITCALPKLAAMPAWVAQQAKTLGGTFTPRAAAEMVRHVENNTLLADLEIRKLLEYVDYARPVEVEDVSRLCGYGRGEADVFAMVDALANRDRRQAMRRIEGMLENEEVQWVFGSIVRHYRQLLAVRELRDRRGGQAEMLVQLGAEPFRISSPFVADKLFAQAGHYSLEQLKAIYRRLLEMDLALKSSQDTRAVFAAFVAENT